MAERAHAGAQERFGSTCRKDAWWLTPALTATGLLILIGYANWAALQGVHYEFGGYL